MSVFNLEQARRARGQASARGGVVRRRTVKIPGHPELYGRVLVTKGRGPRGGRSVLVVHRRKGGRSDGSSET
jgi:hypothetical protein